MPKALPTLEELIAGLPEDRRETVKTLHKAIRKAVPKLKPEVMTAMGPSPIIGYGKYRYKSASGREGLVPDRDCPREKGLQPPYLCR